MNAKALMAAVKGGSVKESTLDDKVQRLLRTVLRYGFLDRPQFDPADSTYSVADRAVALDSARESLTLLKNDGRLLPLDLAKVKTIAIIGPDAWPAVTGGGGSSEAQAFEPVSILTGIANLAGPNVHVLYARGLPEMMDVFKGKMCIRDSCGRNRALGQPRPLRAGAVAAGHGLCAGFAGRGAAGPVVGAVGAPSVRRYAVGFAGGADGPADSGTERNRGSGIGDRE